MGPDPSLADVVVVEVAPKVILSTLGLGPAPGLLDVQVGAVHVGHVPSVGELGELGLGSESSLAEVVAGRVAGHLDSSDGVSDSDDATSPALIEGLVGVGIGSKVRIVIIVGSVKYLRVDDTKDWQFGGAGGVSELRVAAIAGHPAHEAVFLFRPDGGLESEALLVCDTLSEIGVELRDRI